MVPRPSVSGLDQPVDVAVGFMPSGLERVGGDDRAAHVTVVTGLPAVSSIMQYTLSMPQAAGR